MNLNSAITNWETRDQLTKSKELRDELKTPLSERKVFFSSRIDPLSTFCKETMIDLGEGGFQKKNHNQEINE